MSDRILVLIPCYNCAAQVPRVIRQFTARARACVDTVLVLDNGSQDGTPEAAIAAARQISGLRLLVARNQANVNLGGSHKAAFDYAQRHGFSHVLVLHGDDQGRIEDILPLIEAGHHLRHDACLGARFANGASLIGYSRFRIFGNRVFNALFSLSTGRSIQDLGSGLNIFNTKVFSEPAIVRYADDLRFNIFLLLGMIRRGLNISYFPISWREDDQVSNVKMTSQALKTLEILVGARLRPDRFWAADHRAVSHSAYQFDLLWSSETAS